jgi:tetratricopeptide (TPR) repeat protein
VETKHTEKTVFISYRRTNFSWAMAIWQNLTQHGYDVFIDYQGIASGDFETAILENIRSRAHFVIVLTPSALERCNDPDDWMRREIETALESKRNIVSIMLEGFNFDTPTIANQLTGTLTPVKKYNALSVPNEYFLEAMERVRGKFLNVSLAAVVHPASASAKQAAAEQNIAAKDAPLVLEQELTAQQYAERGFASSDFDEQIRFYSEAVRLKPDYGAAYGGRGFARLEKGDLDGALDDLNEAIRLSPDQHESYNNRGRALEGKGDLVGALNDYEATIRLRPDDFHAHNNRGSVRKSKGDVEGALADYNEAVRLKPDYANPYYGRGVIRQEKKQNAAAIADFRQYLKLRGESTDIFTEYVEKTIRELQEKLEAKVPEV